MVRAKEFLADREDRPTIGIKWRNLLVAVFGAGILAYFEGVVATILSLADIPIGLLAGFANFLGDYVFLYIQLPGVILRSGFAGAVPFVADAGIAGFAFALTIVLVSFYLGIVVISRA